MVPGVFWCLAATTTTSVAAMAPFDPIKLSRKKMAALSGESSVNVAAVSMAIFRTEILLMEEIPNNHLGCIKPW